MNIQKIFWINIRKLRRKINQGLFLIIPIAILIMLSILISSQVKNIKDAIHISVFETISEQNTLIEVTAQRNDDSIYTMFGGEMEDTGFSNADLEEILKIDNIVTANLLSPLPIRNAKSHNLFEGKEVSIRTIVGLDQDTATLYTNTDFVYKENEPIPIIINANNFIHSYEDWEGRDEIILERGHGERGTPARTSIIKSEAINYDREDLTEKIFTLSAGGFDDIQSFSVERVEDTGPIIKRLSDEELKEREERRQEEISTYWNYETISNPLEYEFQIVGIIESTSNQDSYIPYEFAQKLMGNYTSKEIAARKSILPPKDKLNTEFLGTIYDGEKIITTFGHTATSRTGLGRMGQGGTSQTHIIPGLIITTTSEGVVTGWNNETDIFDKADIHADKISIKVDAVENRIAVVNKLNSMGYAYQDFSNLEVIEELRETLDKISNGFLISFILLVSATIILTMTKYISEGTKEIGIFRAIGMDKNTISLLFLTQSILYVFIGYTLGLILGIALNFLISPLIANWFDDFVNNTISQTFNVVNIVESSLFSNISWESISMYSILLLTISLLISVIPSRKAASISPVEAIKSE